MSSFKQEWISPILEVYKKRELDKEYTVLLGLNAIGQTVCRELYESDVFETVFVFNSPSFSVWNRYPSQRKPPVVPVHAFVKDNLMLIFGDVFIKDYEWLTDLLFFLQRNMRIHFIISISLHEGPTCGQTLSEKGKQVLEKSSIPRGRSEFYDCLTATLLSLGMATEINPITIHLESIPGEIVLQIEDIAVTREDIEQAKKILSELLGI